MNNMKNNHCVLLIVLQLAELFTVLAGFYVCACHIFIFSFYCLLSGEINIWLEGGKSGFLHES
jgi:hypothetical protein